MGVGKQRCEIVVSKANRTNDSLRTISESIQIISDMSFQVATATEQQACVVEDLNQYIVAINDMAYQTNTIAKENRLASESLEQNSESLSRLVRSFKY